MRWHRRLVAAAVVIGAIGSACGPPVLHNAPRPDPTLAAAAAAAAATAATLADPDGAAKHQEQKNDSAQSPPRGHEVDQSVPPDVLDRLDQAQARDGGAPSAPVPAPAP
jgi:hypothetical protein